MRILKKLLKKKKRNDKDIILGIIIAIKNNLEQVNTAKQLNKSKNNNKDILEQIRTLTAPITQAKYSIGVIVKQNEKYDTSWWNKNVLKLLDNAIENQNLDTRINIIDSIITNIRNHQEEKEK